GSTMFPGLKERLSKELIAMVPEGVEVKVVAPPERRYSVWIGGSIFASLKTFGKKWVTNGTKKEYGDSGLDYVQKQFTDVSKLSTNKSLTYIKI
ncbi:MAG: hypothetical protein ACW99Q_15895, partial [Candidatus Kariarchaeaceae archaeon]